MHMLVANYCLVCKPAESSCMWGMGHTSHVLWSVDQVSLGARFFSRFKREIFKSWFLPGLWRESDAVSWARLVGGGWTLEVVHMLSWGLDRSSTPKLWWGLRTIQTDDPAGTVRVQKTSHDGVLTWLVAYYRMYSVDISCLAVYLGIFFGFLCISDPNWSLF